MRTTCTRSFSIQASNTARESVPDLNISGSLVDMPHVFSVTSLVFMYSCVIFSTNETKPKPVVLWSACDMKKVLAWLQPSYSHPFSSRKIRQECLCVSIMIFLLVRIVHALKTFHWHDSWKQQRKILSAHDHCVIQLMTFPMLTGKNVLLRELFCHHKILAIICSCGF